MQVGLTSWLINHYSLVLVNKVLLDQLPRISMGGEIGDILFFERVALELKAVIRVCQFFYFLFNFFLKTEFVNVVM